MAVVGKSILVVRTFLLFSRGNNSVSLRSRSKTQRWGSTRRVGTHHQLLILHTAMATLMMLALDSKAWSLMSWSRWSQRARKIGWMLSTRSRKRSWSKDRWYHRSRRTSMWPGWRPHPLSLSHRLGRNGILLHSLNRVTRCTHMLAMRSTLRRMRWPRRLPHCAQNTR